MATYDGNSISPTQILYPGDIINYNYAGSVKQLCLPPGKYKLECYGAQGGNGNSSTAAGGYGGYHTGTLITDFNINLYICVGSMGNHTGNAIITVSGGYNGGGTGRGNSGVGTTDNGAGGGCTSITTTNRGILKNFNAYRSEVVLVAGGGGGGMHFKNSNARGGAGGGLTGNAGARSGGSGAAGGGGTQTAGGSGQAVGSFGQGGQHNPGTGSAGGGGGWFGGGAGTDMSGGGGGSGYANPDLLTDIEYINGGRSGNGFARITVIEGGGYLISIQNGLSKPASYFPSEQDQFFDVKLHHAIEKDNKIYSISEVTYEPDTVTLTEINKYHYTLKIPANADYVINIYTEYEDLLSLYNSDIYRDTNMYATAYDVFETLLEEILDVSDDL